MTRRQRNTLTRSFALSHAGNLIPAILAAVFLLCLFAATLGYPEIRFATYVLAGVGIGYSLVALRKMGRNPTGWPTLLVLIFFWAKLVLGMIYVVLLLIGLELVVVGTRHISETSVIGMLASVSVTQLILGVGLYYGALHRVLSHRVDPGFMLRWVFRK